MMEILIPVIFVDEALLVKLFVLGPSVLFILSKMTHFFSKPTVLLTEEKHHQKQSFHDGNPHTIHSH